MRITISIDGIPNGEINGVLRLPQILLRLEVKFGIRVVRIRVVLGAHA